jgi:hypothetical protein
MDNGGPLVSPGVSQNHSFPIVELRLFFYKPGWVIFTRLAFSPG